MACLPGTAAVGCAHAGASSAAPGDLTTIVADERDSHCARPSMGKNGPYRMPLAGPVDDPESMAYLADFPREARRTAQAAGLEPLLVTLLREKEKAGDQLSLPLLASQEELTMRLAAFDTQLSSAAFEIHCTSGQVGDVLAELDHREHSRQITLAVASIMVGALTGVAAGIWGLADKDSQAPNILGIGGSAATAALGVIALDRQDPEVKLVHEHNLLAPVKNGADPDHVYSSFVFRMLTLPDGSEPGSPRAAMLRAWKDELDQAGLPSRESAERTLYGTGGLYSSALVEVRQEHFTRLEAALQSIARDLELLERFIVRKVFAAAAGPEPGPAPK